MSVPRLLGPDDLVSPDEDSPGAAANRTTDLDGAATPASQGAPVLGQAVALASLAFLLMLAEGTATDWSAVHAVEHLRLSESVAALAYGTFAVAMTIGRLTADRVVAKVGPVALVR